MFFSQKDKHFLSKTFTDFVAMVSSQQTIDKLKNMYNFMIFKPRQKRRKHEIPVRINNCDIVHTNEVVFSGVSLDENLSWKPHILNVSKKTSESIGIIYKSGFCLSTACLLCTFF